MNEIFEKLLFLARTWEQQAFDQVPIEYSSRNLIHKYYKLDNEAAGLISCAQDLRALLDECRAGGAMYLDSPRAERQEVGFEPDGAKYFEKN